MPNLTPEQKIYTRDMLRKLFEDQGFVVRSIVIGGANQDTQVYVSVARSFDLSDRLIGDDFLTTHAYQTNTVYVCYHIPIPDGGLEAFDDPLGLEKGIAHAYQIAQFCVR